MKILIWIHKNDVIANKISSYYFTRPYIDRHDDYVQVGITQEQFVKLEDNALTSLATTEQIVEEFFNDDIEYAHLADSHMVAGMSNDKDGSFTKFQKTQDKFQEKSISAKDKDDWLVDQYNRNRNQKDWVKDRSEIPYIYERNGNEVYRRREGDYERELITNDEFHASKKEIKKGLKQLLIELQTVSGGNFANWWKGLTKDEQITLTKFWE